ncbi:MAG: branched-chain amino acid ABC transporter permease, partial [Paracoccaceae bacterium]
VAVTGSFVLGLLVALPLTAAVGYAAEITIARSLYTRDHLDHVLATFGLILIADTSVHFFWGAEGMGIPTPWWAQGRVAFAGAEIPLFRLVIVGTGLAVAIGLWLLVTRTRLGMRIRAGASDRAMVQALGVDIQRLFAIVFALGAAMAGLAGLMIAPITEASIGMGNEIIIVAFVVIIIGGIGSIKGAFVGALIVGVIDTMGRSYLDVLLLWLMSADHAETAAPALSAMLIYILMAAILVIRPQGLFPPRTR